MEQKSNKGNISFKERLLVLSTTVCVVYVLLTDIAGTSENGISLKALGDLGSLKTTNAIIRFIIAGTSTEIVCWISVEYLVQVIVHYNPANLP